jgi:hypothetical protein
MPAGQTIKGLAKQHGGCDACFLKPINTLNVRPE